MVKRRENLIPGTLGALILKTVSQGPLHGYAMSKWIQRMSKNVLRVEEGVLYPALHKLEAEGCLSAEWGLNDTGRRAKFYSITPFGEKRLREDTERWARSAGAVFEVLDVKER